METKRPGGMAARLLQEPFAVFLIAGSVLFWMYSAAAVDERPTISVSEMFIAELVAEREMVLERELRQSEIELIRQNFIDQEVLVREAMARQLYLNDGQVRHRLADKMYYLLTSDVREPTEAELEAFFVENGEKYRTPELITFSHRFFGDDKNRAQSALSNSDVDDNGDSFYMGSSIERYAQAELLPIFGRTFIETLDTLPIGLWQGPFLSGRGWHVVRVEDRIPSRVVTRDELGDQLLIDWRDVKLFEARRKQLDDLRINYRVVAAGSDRNE